MKIKLLLSTLAATLFLFTSFAQIAKITTEAVTPHDLTTGEFNTNSVSSGLDVVAKGTYVYLSAHNIENSDPILTALFEIISKPAGSNTTIEIINPTWVQFKPDANGAYQVKLTITTSSGTDDITKTIYSSNYVGVGNFQDITAHYPTCMTCHENRPNSAEIFERWKVSGHANIFNQQIETSDHYSTSCMKCHTTGYDHNIAADNGGFDDVAASLGWSYVPPSNSGKWDTLVTQYTDLVQLATIGCESCHGAGSEHTLGTNPEKIAISLEAGVCAQCHDEPWRHNKFSEYENSLHSEAVWERTTGSNANTNNLGDCIRCHDGVGYANFTKGLTTNAISWTEELNATRITCASCHDPHGNSNTASLRSRPDGSDTLSTGYRYTELSVLGIGMLCLDCHKARQNNVTLIPTQVNQRWGPHSSTQGDVFLGLNAAEFGSPIPYNSSPHKYAVEDGCVGCHMVATVDTGNVNRDKVGGHSWNLHNEETGYYHTTRCVSCHGEINSWEDFAAYSDFDNDGITESIPGEIDGLLMKLRIQLPPTGVDSISWQMIRDTNDVNIKKAYFNYQLILNDGSKGMHNTNFAVDVLTQSINAIGGIVSVNDLVLNVPDEFSLAQNYPNPFNPTTTIRYNVPFESDVKIVVFNINGEVVRELFSGIKPAGTHEVNFNLDANGIQLSSGVYFYSIDASSLDGKGSFRETKKMVLLK